MIPTLRERASMRDLSCIREIAASPIMFLSADYKKIYVCNSPVLHHRLFVEYKNLSH